MARKIQTRIKEIKLLQICCIIVNCAWRAIRIGGHYHVINWIPLSFACGVRVEQPSMCFVESVEHSRPRSDKCARSIC